MLAMSPSNHEIHRFTCCGSFVSSAPAGHPSRSLLAPVAREPSTPWLPALPACVVEVGLGSRCVTSADLHWWLCEPRTLHSWADCLHSPQLRRDPESANSSAVCEPAQWEPGDTRAHCQGWLLLRNTQVCPTLPPWNSSNPHQPSTAAQTDLGASAGAATEQTLPQRGQCQAQSEELAPFFAGQALVTTPPITPYEGEDAQHPLRKHLAASTPTTALAPKTLDSG